MTENFQFLIAHMNEIQLKALCRLLEGALDEVQRLRRSRS